MARYLGIDIGGTKLALGLWEADASTGASADPTLLAREAIETPRGPEPLETIAMLAGRAKDLLAARGETSAVLAGIGISCGGPLDRRTGRILGPPNLPGWDDVPIVSAIAEELGAPAAIENDANACALAEWAYGSGRGTGSFVFLTFGTGLGAGIVINGALYRGASEMAGEIGHIRLAPDGPIGYGKPGSAEGFCSGAGIAQLGTARARDELAAGRRPIYCETPERLGSITARTIADAARAGDEAAREVYAASGRELGRLLAIVVDTLNPEVIAIGSIFTRAHDLLWPAARETLAAESLERSRNACTVVPAALGERIGDYAALAIASAVAAERGQV